MSKPIEGPRTIQLAEHQTTPWYHVPPEGVPFEDVCKSEYWKHVALHFMPGHRIEIWNAENTYWAKLLVRAVTRRDVEIYPLEYHELGEMKCAGDNESVYTAKWVSPTLRYGVIRNSDNERIKENFQTLEDAQKWVRGRQSIDA